MSLTGDLKKIFKGRHNDLMKLIFINCILFIVTNLSMGIAKLSGSGSRILIDTLALSPDFSFFATHFWTLLTYQFTHVELFHLAFNMLWLYWLGMLFVEYIGSRQLISTYILGGFSGGILFLICGAAFPSVFEGAPLIGASAAVMAIVVALAFLIPNYVFHLFLIGEIRLKYIALFSFILSSLIDLSSNTGGKIAHIGGALYGYLFIVLYRKGTNLGKPIDLIMNYFKNMGKTRGKMNVAYKKPVSDEVYNANKRVTEKRTDEILDKISRSGYDSLSREEKEFLFKQGDKRL